MDKHFIQTADLKIGTYNYQRSYTITDLELLLPEAFIQVNPVTANIKLSVSISNNILDLSFRLHSIVICNRCQREVKWLKDFVPATHTYHTQQTINIAKVIAGEIYLHIPVIIKCCTKKNILDCDKICKQLISQAHSLNKINITFNKLYH